MQQLTQNTQDPGHPQIQSKTLNFKTPVGRRSYSWDPQLSLSTPKPNLIQKFKNKTKQNQVGCLIVRMYPGIIPSQV